ncbi:MAG TPA: energy transducer TonB, partial [Rhodocyclaceae bacterium]|nr:energy transducer TonB [Rhodocyclaceae bacterium]
MGLSPLLAFGLTVSLLLHGLVLSTGFLAPPQPAVHQRDRGLEVVLVNARHARAPDAAQVLAQANLDGGGTTEQDTRPTTPA